MLGLGFGLLLVGFVLITWGGAEVAREAEAGPPPGGCALIVLWVLSAQTKAGKIGWILIFLGMLLLILIGEMYS